MSYPVIELEIAIDGVYAETGILLRGWAQEDTYTDNICVGVDPATGKDIWAPTTEGSAYFICTGFLQEHESGIVIKHELKKPIKVCEKGFDTDKVEWYVDPETLVNQVLMNKEVN